MQPTRPAVDFVVQVEWHRFLGITLIERKKTLKLSNNRLVRELQNGKDLENRPGAIQYPHSGPKDADPHGQA